MLRKHVIIAVTILVLNAIIGISLLSTLNLRKEAEVSKSVETLTNHTADYVSVQIQSKLEQINIWATSKYSKIFKSTEEELLAILEIFASSMEFRTVGISDIHGNAILSDGSKINIKEREYFKSAIKGKKTISNVLKSKLDEEEIIVYAVPLYYQGEVVGVLSASDLRDNLGEFLYPIYYNGVANIHIVDHEGNLIASNNEEVLQYENYFEYILKYNEDEKIEILRQGIIKDVSGYGKFNIGKDKKQRIVGFSPLDYGNDWDLIVSLDYDAMVSDTKNLISSLMLFILYTTSFFTIFLIFFSKKYDKKKVFEEKMAIKDEFLSNMSHEIRTPISGIIGLTNMSNQKYAEGKDIKPYLDNIGAISNHLLEVVNNILDINKLNAGELKLEEEIFSMKELIEEVILILSSKAEEKNIKILPSIECSLCDQLIGDKNKIKVILINHIDNAIKFSKENGSVQVIVNKELISKEKVKLNIQIIDDGIGIKKDALENIFNSFEQADSSISKKYGGTGLGLNISKSFAELMEGNIEVKSELGVGSTFSLNLILKCISGYEFDKKEASIKTYDFAGKKVLIAEDNEVNIMIIEDILDRVNLSQEYAVNGKKAVEMVMLKPVNYYDFIIMDIQMPELDGYSATKIIREHEINNNYKKLPIIAMTANAREEDKLRSIEAGMDAHINKPVDVDQLYQTIDSLLKIK